MTETEQENITEGDDENNDIQPSYECRSYTFHTFPRGYLGNFTRDITIDPDCVEFHKTVGTDFQLWITKGINYFQTSALKALKKKSFTLVDVKVDVEDENDLPTLDEDEEGRVDMMKSSYDEWLKTEEKTFSVSEYQSKVRKHFYYYINSQSPYFQVTTINNPEEYKLKTIIVTRCTKEESEEIDKKKKQDLTDKYNETIGFTYIWKEITKSGKPFIAHNCYLDLAFSLDHFSEYLPSDYEKYKHLLRKTIGK